MKIKTSKWLPTSPLPPLCTARFAVQKAKMSDKAAKINIYDQNAVKQLLDDVAMEHVLEKGYVEDNTLTNWKLILGLISCALAALSHFYPTPFPENIPILKLCVISYFIISIILQALAYLKEKNIIISTLDSTVGKRKHKAFDLSTVFLKYDENFTIHVNLRGGSNDNEKSVTHSIGRWFDAEGKFNRPLYKHDLDGLIESVQKVD